MLQGYLLYDIFMGHVLPQWVVWPVHSRMQSILRQSFQFQFVLTSAAREPWNRKKPRSRAFFWKKNMIIMQSSNRQVEQYGRVQRLFYEIDIFKLGWSFQKNALSAPPRTRLTPIKVWRMIYYWRLAKKVESCAPQVLWKQTWLASVVKLHSFTRESD